MPMRVNPVTARSESECAYFEAICRKKKLKKLNSLIKRTYVYVWVEIYSKTFSYKVDIKLN